MNQKQDPTYEELLKRIRELELQNAQKHDKNELSLETPVIIRSVMRNAPEFIILFNQDGFVLDMNRNDLEFFEKSKEEIVGKHFTTLTNFTPEEKQVYSDVFQQVIQGMKINVLEIPITRSNSRSVVVEIHVNLIEISNTEKVLLVIGRNVSKQRSASTELLTTRRELEKLIRERTEELKYVQEAYQKNEALREKVQKELRESEEKFGRILDNIGSQYFIYSHGVDGVFNYLSKSVEKILGYTHGEFMTHYTEYLTDTPENQKVIEYTEKAIAGERQPPYQVEIFHKNGKIKTLEVSEYPLKDSDGNVIAIEGVARDITDQVIAMHYLKQSEDRFRRIAENSNDIIVRLVPGKGVEYINPAIERLSGFAKNEITGQVGLLMEKIHPDDRNGFVEAVRQASFSKDLTPDKQPHVFRFYTKYGDMLWCEMQPAIVTDERGHVASIEFVGRDITKRIKKEEKIKHEKRILDSVIDFNPYAIQLLDNSGNSLRVNQAFRELIGIPEDLNSTNIDISMFFDEDRENSLAKVKSGNVLQYPERVFKRKRAEVIEDIYIKSVLFPIFGIDGEIENYVFMHEDVTPRKKAEKEKDDLQAQLLHSQKMEAIGTLAGGMAHEFNNILSVVMGTAEMIQKNIVPEDANYKRVERIIKSSERAKSLSMQLLTFARKDKMNHAIVFLNDVVKETISILEKSIPPKINLTLDLQENIPPVWADSNQLQQALLNLCINAIDSIKDRGAISVETRLEEIDSSLPSGNLIQKPVKFCVLCIRDTGTGIADGTLGKIFEPFFTTKEKGQGTGLGLSITHSIIQEHNGYIKVESEPGKGTVFSIYIPETHEKPLAGETHISRDLSGHGEKLLLVDDNDDVRQVLSDLLIDAGYKVITASGGNEALSIYEEMNTNIDIVLLDILMPEMDGSEVFARLIKINPNVKVLFVSAYSEDHIARGLIEKGAKWFVQKPYKTENLLAKLRIITGVS